MESSDIENINATVQSLRRFASKSDALPGGLAGICTTVSLKLQNSPQWVFPRAMWCSLLNCVPTVGLPLKRQCGGVCIHGYLTLSRVSSLESRALTNWAAGNLHPGPTVSSFFIMCLHRAGKYMSVTGTGDTSFSSHSLTLPTLSSKQAC